MLIHTCDEIFFVLDEREGTTVCTNCGYVVDSQLYVNTFSYNNEVPETEKQEFNEILSRLNLTSDIVQQEKDIDNLSSLYSVINKTSAVTMNEFCLATGLAKKKVVKSNRNSICATNESILLDKYCKLLNICFKDYTVIKEKISSFSNKTGHSPLTIIGYYIYVCCKKKYKLSIQKVCNVIGISPISIQRFKKYEFSCGSSLSTR